MDWVNITKDFGLIGVVVIAFVSAFYINHRFVLAQFKEELENNRQERKEYLQSLANINQNMEEHNCRAKEFQGNVQAEHRQMIECLGRINGYKK